MRLGTGTEGLVMPIMRRLGALSGQIAAVAMLAVPSVAQAVNEPIQVRFEPARQVTRVAGRIAPELCFSFDMPQEWRARTEGSSAKLNAVLSNAELEVSLRSADELRHMPQPDLASRDAAFLQQGYEDLLGRPAQSISLASSGSGATRWSATWVDAHLPMASHAMTIEAFIVPLSNAWVLELSLTNNQTREAYNALVQKLLAGLRVQTGLACGG
jgi:hypothetical protein